MKYIICLLLCLPTFLSAQDHLTLNVIALDGQTNAPIKNVRVTSRFALNTKKHPITDFLGRASLIPIQGDTITFDHPDYYHLHIILHDHAPHDFAHPLKVSLTKMHPDHSKDGQSATTYTPHFFEPQQAHHHLLKIGVIEDNRAGEHRKSWLETPRTQNKDFNLLDIHLRTKKE